MPTHTLMLPLASYVHVQLLAPGDCFSEVSFFTQLPNLEVRCNMLQHAMTAGSVTTEKRGMQFDSWHLLRQ